MSRFHRLSAVRRLLPAEGMRILLSLVAAVTLVVLSVIPAEAQRRQPPPPRRPAPVLRTVPREGTVAAGASLGATATRSQFLDNGLELAGNIERYVRPRVSVRGQVGAAWWDITGLSYSGTLRPVFFLGNVVYYWPGDDWRPFATGGGGAYRFGFNEAGLSGSKTKVGFDFGGGVDYSATPDVTVAVEVLFHRVGLVPTNRAALGFRGSFWSFALAAKRYF